MARQVLLVLALAAACGAPARPGPDDAGDPGGGSADGGGPDAPGAGFWAPCETVLECGTDLCYTAPGEATGHCTEYCDGVCPDGFECRIVPLDDGIEAAVCVPGADSFCDACALNQDCGDTRDLCVDLTAGRFCSIDCEEDPTICPPGFTCQHLGDVGDIVDAWQCMPQNGVCCIDGDGDLRGDGAGCVTTDCDDGNPAVYDDAVEVCDGFDNDCAGGVDVDPIDCAAASCLLGVFGYFERPAEPCVAGDCVPQDAVLCGLYTCSEGGELGDRCATACDGEDDGKCIPTGHCDAGVCLEDLADGNACDEDSDCESAHCQNGFCCDGGDCCAVAMDCPTFGSYAPVCGDPATCQGARGDATCTGFICGAVDGVPDDSACGPTIVANECGFFRAVHCTGAADQAPPVCPATCASHADCDAGGFCDPATRTCREDLDDGLACASDPARCKSGHCQNGFCCASGDCCAAEDDCPASYSSPPECAVPAACQGYRDVAQCRDFRCTTAMNVDDDSACGPSIVADECGPYLSLSCDGNSVQTPPACPTSCASDAQCDASAYCDGTGACAPDEPDGGACQDAAECRSGHCQNGFCCASGDCCAGAGDCDAYDQPAACETPSGCQGRRVEGTCSAAKQCGTTMVDDDSGCAGLEANACGPYPPVQCTTMVDQPADQAARCAASCSGDAGCDASAHCAGGVCVPDTGPGGYCEQTSECESGLACVDNVCCTSACNGSCQACDLPGFEGTCTNVPDGQDPDGECGAVSCSAWYWGWLGDACYRRADVSSAQSTCGGDGACRTTSEACALQTARGGAALTCHSTCQDPTAGTCAGTTAGTCQNVNPGTQSCGDGVCRVTVPLCENGAPKTCVPNDGAASPETCNDIDDDCDGSVDDGNFSDGREPNGSCGSVSSLPGVGSNQTQTVNTVTIYGYGDNDVYRIRASETDSSCECCNFFCTDEDYRLSVRLTVPAGAGSYFLCVHGSACDGTWDCAEVLAGSSGTRALTFDGGCPGGDAYDAYVRVYGDNAPAYECAPYTLSYTFTPGCY